MGPISSTRVEGHGWKGTKIEPGCNCVSPVTEEEFEAEEKALGPAVSVAGSGAKLAGGLDGSRPENVNTKNLFNIPSGLWKREK